VRKTLLLSCQLFSIAKKKNIMSTAGSRLTNQTGVFCVALRAIHSLKSKKCLVNDHSGAHEEYYLPGVPFCKVKKKVKLSPCLTN
jgi:hypothetical protein